MSQYQEIHDEVFHILETQLPSFLTYHTPGHTRYVLEKSEMISEKENVHGHDLELIRLAALFHDIGFIEDHYHHEERSCVICSEMLTRRGFSKEDIGKICGMIMATKIPQQPQTLNQMIVADADLEYLGTDLFHPVSQTLFHEFHHYDPKLDLQRFNEIQVKFMTNHHYHTGFCIQHRDAKKQEHLMALLALV